MNKILIAAFLLLLSSCSLIADQYDYKPRFPGEIPATMQFQETAPGVSVHVRQVNGLYLFNYGGTVSKEIKKNSIRLSPGSNSLSLLINNGKADGTLPVKLNVESGEQYSLHVSDEFVWIANKRGKTVADLKYRMITSYGMKS